MRVRVTASCSRCVFAGSGSRCGGEQVEHNQCCPSALDQFVSEVERLPSVGGLDDQQPVERNAVPYGNLGVECAGNIQIDRHLVASLRSRQQLQCQCRHAAGWRTYQRAKLSPSDTSLPQRCIERSKAGRDRVNFTYPVAKHADGIRAEALLEIE